MTDTTHNRITDGNLLRAILLLAGPMMASSVLQNVQSLIDLFWVGRLGAGSVAALAMSGTMLMLLFPVVLGLATGTVAIVSRHVGAGEMDEASRVAGQSLLAGIVIGIITGAVGWWLAPRVVTLFRADAAVAELAAAYLRINLAGIVTMILLFIGSSAMRGAGNATVPMLAMVLSNIINIVLDPIMIFGLLGVPAMGVRGAAAATVLAQFFAMLIIMIAMASGRTGLHVTLSRWRPHPVTMWRLLRIGMPSTIQMVARSLMGIVLMRLVASCGTAAIAAHGIGVRLHMMLLLPAFAFGNATATMVGQNLGAKRPERARLAAWMATAMDGLVMLGAAIVLLFWAPSLIAFFNDDVAVIEVGTRMLRIVTPFFIFVGLAIIMSRALMGAGDTTAPMVTTLVALWGVQVPLAIGLARVMQPATDGIWWAMSIAIMLHGLMNAGWFMTGRWKHREV
ncbi:MAG: MATE family efflux transporter [Kiritimatiellia bacterium]|jgi:putative MATE family efflux protein|nr:MATE family efflux transporter [Kiritimatiellia bacterium]MDP6811147.1 MATE family efflux transporter [Kiritimatiellia bacterium]MDP7025296.1 MATE family efflux transporter [Kiritimatiellia bacterium]